MPAQPAPTMTTSTWLGVDMLFNLRRLYTNQ
jgi:hypothetical protein